MVKTKYDTQIYPNLDKVADWASRGVAAIEIAKRLRVGYSTFRKYYDRGAAGDERYKALADVFARGSKVSNDHVEAALYKRACGMDCTEVKREQKLDREGNMVVLETHTDKAIPPDPISAMFWLTNRRRDKWKYKPEAQGDEEAGETGVIMLAPAGEEPRPREEGDGE